MFGSPLIYFTDAVLRGPTIGCMLMCLATAIVGVIVFLRKESLLGESLSHATYPGVVCGVICLGSLAMDDSREWVFPLYVLTGAFITAFLGLGTIGFLNRRMHVRSDSALCFVLSAFFGIGITLASYIQFTHASLYRQAMSYLYGQAATMTDAHIWIYGILSAAVIGFVFFIRKELQLIIFDRDFAKSIGYNTKLFDTAIFLVIVLAIVISIRSVGVVLLSAMLIAPAAAARQFTDHMNVMFILAGFFGLLSGFAGNYFSVELTDYFSTIFPNAKLYFPTGPMIVLAASILCLGALLFAPKRGFLSRQWRVGRFRYQCRYENLLISMYRMGSGDTISFEEITKNHKAPKIYLWWMLQSLIRKGWIAQTKFNTYYLTSAGEQRAAQIERLHRLWEVYMIHYVGLRGKGVDYSAGEMEHIITPELEKELMQLLLKP